MNIYFDFYKHMNDCFIGVVAYEGDYSIKPSFKKIIKIDKGADFLNQYHLSIKAFSLAVEELYMYYRKGNKIDKAVFINQNEYIFKWLINQNYSKKYSYVFEELEKNLLKIIDTGLEFEYKVVKGKDNRAKDYIKRESLLYNSNEGAKLDFNSLRKKFNATNNPIQHTCQQDNVVYVEKFHI